MESNFKGVKVWEEDIIIPTYPIGDPDKNPMFLEKRVYQGSSGRVYPHPVIDKICDEKIDKTYHAVFIENKYLQIVILPEIGGRVQRALDKTNQYDFVYYNKVIKPALVGLAGPWISGGIEFNWPQHHRPSTFDPVDFTIEEGEDGSKTVWVSEMEKMFRTKGMAGFRLYPDKAYLEINVQIYNRTADPQTFLWWANPAVAVNDYTQSVFPPDVHAVFDHGKRDVSEFPIAKGTYYKMDYSAGVDISRYKNIPVPTSYMAYHSDFNFVGGYDEGKNAGILHVANHHISPGKKQWTWGCGDFGQAWDRNLTDEDGPYIELMTGVYTDNQPDFSWLAPYEEKTWKQYFMPYKDIGYVKNATIDGAVNLEINENKASLFVYTTGEEIDAHIVLKGKNKLYLDIIQTISPEKIYSGEFDLDGNEIESDLTVTVTNQYGKEIVTYSHIPKTTEKIPDAAKPALSPAEIKTNESLFLTGLHIEQYRHATYEADDYYLEGLKRDPSDIRINNAYGKLLYRRGLFSESEIYFNKAIEAMTVRNPNPYDGEAYFNLGLSLKMQGKLDKAFDAFYKAIWNDAWQAAGYYELACIASKKQNYNEALELVEKAIVRNYHNYKARNLKSSLLRKTKQYTKSLSFTKETIALDILEFGARWEEYLLNKETNVQCDILKNEIKKLMRDNSHSYIEIAIDYGNCGLYVEALELLTLCSEITLNDPMTYYYLSYYSAKCNDTNNMILFGEKAANSKPDYCFPNRLDDILVLEHATINNLNDGNAFYFLGNLWYDRKQTDKATHCWETACKINPDFPTNYRNLSLAYYNKYNDAKKATVALEKAFGLNKDDARVFLELDQLYKKTNMSPRQRIKNFKKHLDLVEQRDDLYLEYVTLLNLTDNAQKSLNLINNRNFHPWEGGEGKVPAQYIHCHVELAKDAIKSGEFETSILLLNQAKVYPHHLGEGKLAGAQENNIHYFLGCAYEGLGDIQKSQEYFVLASQGLDEPTSAIYYNDQPPEMIFYQGLACSKLNNHESANSRFNKLIDYAAKHISDDVKIDYFAVSLPDFLIFNEDLNKRNVIHCHNLFALGYLGLNQIDKATEEFKTVLNMDANHLGALIHLSMAEDITR